jgi:dTDP-4-dehydrorhamnose 3,5-epimerase
MDGKNIVITGGNGQLGRALQQLLPAAVAIDRDELDITDPAAVASFDWTGIEVIINAAAYTNVDGAETPEGAELAQKINVAGVQNLVDLAKAKDLKLVHVSTDYVFDGHLADHLESEPMSPISVYGKTKAEADQIVLGLPKGYIVRTSWVIGDGKNFVRTMLGLGQKGISPNVVDDQLGRLTFASELARAIKYLLDKPADYGVYNVTNSGPIKSWADITKEIFADAGFDLSVGYISTEKYFEGKENIAPRPTNSDLNLDKLHSTGFESKDWQTELKDYIIKETEEDK